MRRIPDDWGLRLLHGSHLLGVRPSLHYFLLSLSSTASYNHLLAWTDHQYNKVFGRYGFLSRVSHRSNFAESPLVQDKIPTTANPTGFLRTKRPLLSYCSGIGCSDFTCFFLLLCIEMGLEFVFSSFFMACLFSL